LRRSSRKQRDGGSNTPAPVPTLGLFEWCPLNDDGVTLQTCQDRLQTFAKAGFKVVQFQPSDGTVEDLGTYFSTAPAGMQFLWNLSDPALTDLSQPAAKSSFGEEFSQWLEQCDSCQTVGDLLQYLVGQLKQYPTYGYYLIDDSLIWNPDAGNNGGPGPFYKDTAAAKALVSAVREIDPDRPVMFSSWMYDADEVEFGALEKIPGVFANELYPFSDSTGTDWASVEQSIEKTRERNKSLGRPVVFYLQGAETDGDYYPSRKQLSALWRRVLTQGAPNLVLWYRAQEFFSTPEGYSGEALFDAPTQPGQRWADLQAVIAERPDMPSQKKRHRGKKQ